MTDFTPGPGFEMRYGEKVVSLPKPQKKLRVIHKTSLGPLGSLFFDSDVPEDFSLPTFISSIRAVGYLLFETVYVPLDEIAAILVWSEDKPPPQMNVLPFEGKKS